ncbi:MAG: hypothetical protein A2003_13340 [Acinetobacter sp. GWC1_38_13]|uniref:hypothetical protein n=1 Tax=Acinetobacter sp. GWC1_38_13 TaxID=1797234 RepID=UPI0008D20830|nr:hypothetical protein [Acinetobacter sp. GWC1_38_13]OFW44137.1 MAG: hypothetical protein A2003_13340 [Acinetobacter sp. GWC1_38_13]
MTKDIEREALITEIDHFINEAKKSYIVERWAVSYENSNPFSHTINDKNEVWWMKAQARQLWEFWQAAKAQAVPDGFVSVPKEPTPKMIDATWSFDEEIQDMSHNSRNEFIYKNMIRVAIEEAARGGNE